MGKEYDYCTNKEQKLVLLGVMILVLSVSVSVSSAVCPIPVLGFFMLTLCCIALYLDLYLSLYFVAFCIEYIVVVF